MRICGGGVNSSFSRGWECYQSLSILFWIYWSNKSKFVPLIYQVLEDEYLATPYCEKDWIRLADETLRLWAEWNWLDTRAVDWVNRVMHDWVNMRVVIRWVNIRYGRHTVIEVLNMCGAVAGWGNMPVLFVCTIVRNLIAYVTSKNLLYRQVHVRTQLTFFRV